MNGFKTGTYNTSFQRIPKVGGFNRVQVLVEVDAGQNYLFEWIIPQERKSDIQTRMVS